MCREAIGKQVLTSSREEERCTGSENDASKETETGAQASCLGRSVKINTRCSCWF